MIAQPPAESGENKLRQVMHRLRGCPEETPDCQKPDASPDLPLTHGLRLTGIETRLTALERSVSNQNRLLLVGVIAIVGDVLKQVLKP